MKKFILDLVLVENKQVQKGCHLLKMTHSSPFPTMLPGQFAELEIKGSSEAFLRRPISIHYYDKEQNQIWFLVQQVGSGTAHLASLKPGEKLNVILPLGNGFTLIETNQACKALLVGGGVGVAPLLFLGKKLKGKGIDPIFLLGARSQENLLQIEEFTKTGEVFVTTEDGSRGEKGFVTQHSVLENLHFDIIYTCGPKPMMQSVAKFAREHEIECEVSLENRMACGLGACLCCVEDTEEGNVCVCKEGPVFNIKRLSW
jgi:dihydroorotate dehydrogenase electron transfer subunit